MARCPRASAAWYSPTNSSTPCPFTQLLTATDAFASYAWRGTGASFGIQASPAGEEIADYMRRYFPPPTEEGAVFEVNLEALGWLERIARALQGYVFTIDYGYTRGESVRFPRGTLMSYRRHHASEDVLDDPGVRDITAHVSFTALQEHGARLGLQTVCFETLARTLLSAGEPDQFQAALAAATAADELRRRLQLKSLLFGMGETFRTLIQRAGGAVAEGATK